MEETLGKRIASNRRHLGITQDRLAEQLGVTAQAVSKWENDQSCPDITMLPRLAAIFSISTDELLGCVSQRTPAPEAEVVETAPEPEPKESAKGNLEFHWDAGKRSSITAAVWVMLVGVLLLAGNFLQQPVSFWDALWSSALLVFGASSLLAKITIFRLCATLFGAYAVLLQFGIINIALNRNLILPVILVLLGLSQLIEAIRKPRRGAFTVTRNGQKVSRHQRLCSVEGESFDCSTSFGEDTQHIDLPRLSTGAASVSFGELTVDLTGCQDFSENCRVEATCSFGELTLLIPRRCRVEAETSTAFASIDFSGHPDPESQSIIFLSASANFGEITVRYI